MKNYITIPIEKLIELRNQLKNHPGAINEISKRCGHSHTLTSLILSGKRKFTDKNIKVIIEAKKIIEEQIKIEKEKSDALIAFMQL